MDAAGAFPDAQMRRAAPCLVLGPCRRAHQSVAGPAGFAYAPLGLAKDHPPDNNKRRASPPNPG